MELQLLANELAITMANPDTWRAIALALAFGGGCLAFGTWLTRTVGLLDRDAPAGETLGVGLAAGLMVGASLWAAVWSGGRSSFTPVAIGFAMSIVLALARNRRPSEGGAAKRAQPAVRAGRTAVRWSPRRSLVVAALAGGAFVIVIALLYGSTFTLSPRDGGQPIERIDTSFYAVLGRDLSMTGTETNTLPSGFASLSGESPQTWYHWGELWLASAIISVFGAAPLAARHLVVLPLLLLATAALTGTLVRRMSGRTSRLPFAFGFVACLILAPMPLVPGPFFSAWPTGLLGGITVFGLAAVVVAFSLYLVSTLGSRESTWALTCFAGTAIATVLPAHIVIAILGVVGVGVAWTVRIGRSIAMSRRLPTVGAIWQRTLVAAAIAIGATAVWGAFTGHGLGSGGVLQELSPFNASWRETVGIVALQGGLLLVPFVAWLVLWRRAPDVADLCLGASALIVAGAIVWGWRLSTFNMFYFFFGGIALFLTLSAIVAVWLVVDRIRASGHRALAYALIALCVVQLELGAVVAVGRIQLASSTYTPIPLGVLNAIEGLPSTAKLAYACQPLEEISFVNSKLLGIDAHTGRRIVPMCFEADALGPLLGLERSTERPDAGFAFAPQRALYGDSAARPSRESIVGFLKTHGIDYIYADAAHPNTLVPDATPILSIGQFQLSRIP